MGKAKWIHAFGCVIELTALVEVLVKEQTVGGKTVKAKIHVSKGEDDEVTLGTNVLSFLGYRLVHEGNARALTLQQQAESLRREREGPTPPKKKRKDRRRTNARAAEVEHRKDVTPDPSTGVQLADGTVKVTYWDQPVIGKTFVVQERIAPRQLQGRTEPKCHVFKETAMLWEARPLVDKATASENNPSSSMVECGRRRSGPRRGTRSTNSRRS